MLHGHPLGFAIGTGGTAAVFFALGFVGGLAGFCRSVCGTNRGGFLRAGPEAGPAQLGNGH